MTSLTPPSSRVRFTANCFVRAAPDRRGAILAVMRRGDSLPGRSSPGSAILSPGWLAVTYRGLPGWVSARFACVNGQ